MPHFRYQALNANQQTVSGELAAETVQQAIAHLEAEGLTVQSIGYAPPQATPGFPPHMEPGSRSAGYGTARQPAGSVERAVLESHMAKVLQQARAITPALRAYADEMPSGRRRRELRTVCRVLDGGDVAEATRELETLPEYWIPLLSAATSSRDPGRVLQEFLTESHRADELRRQWWLTLSYPVIIACVAAVVLTVISFLVIPVFAELYQEFDLELPALTLVVVGVSYWLVGGGAVIVAVVVAGVGLLLLRGGRWWTSTVGTRFGMPFGRSTAIARFAQFTADLLEAGLDVPGALRIAGFTTRKPRLRRAAWHLANDLEQGVGAVQPAHRLLSATVLHALRGDMATSSRIRLLREIGECYAGRARLRLSWTYGIIEPITIVVVGALVGGVAIALFMPLVKLVEGLSG